MLLLDCVSDCLSVCARVGGGCIGKCVVSSRCLTCLLRVMVVWDSALFRGVSKVLSTLVDSWYVLATLGSFRGIRFDSLFRGFHRPVKNFLYPFT